MFSFVTGPNEFSGLSNSASLAQRCHTPIFQRALDEQWIVGDLELADPVSQASAGRAWLPQRRHVSTEGISKSLKME